MGTHRRVAERPSAQDRGGVADVPHGHQHPYRHRHQVVVVGARCAGSATAMLLARQGVDVAVVDRAMFPSDTFSTHALARGGVVQLARWGLLDRVMATGAPAIREVAFHTPDEVTVRTIKDRAGVDHLAAPRRTALDAVLVEAAAEAGAHLHCGITVTDVCREADGRVTGIAGRDLSGAPVRFDADLVVGADGLRSRVARSVDAEIVESVGSNAAIHYTYAADIGATGFEYHLGDGAFAGVFPTNAGEANVWACTSVDAVRPLRSVAGDKRDAFVELVATVSPTLADRMRQGRVTAGVRGAVRLPNHLRTAVGPGWALVGDAAYHRDPITGHGMTDAFRGAELLARHVGPVLAGPAGPADHAALHDALAAYAHEHERTLRPIFDLTCRLVQFPPIAEFVELQRQLSRCIESEAMWLAELPPITAAPVAA